MSKRWVALVAAVATTGGCTKYIKVDRPVSEVEVRRFDDPPSIDENWSYDGNVVATAGTNDIALKIEAIRFKSCTTKTHRVVRKTEAADRHWDDSGSKEFFHWGSVLALGAMGLGLVSRYGLDNSFTTVGDDGKDTFSTTGWLTIFGGLTAAYVVPVAIGTDFLAINGSRDLGESDDVTSSTKRCQVGPAAGARVKVPGSEGATNDAGVFEARVTNADLARATSSTLIEVEGHGLASPSLVAQRDQLAKEMAAQQQQAADAARIASIDRASDAEVAAGACSTDRKSELPRILGTVQQVLEQSLGFVVLDHVTTVATPAGTRLPFSFPTAGEYHLFAFSYSPLRFKGGTGDSPFGPGFEGMTGARVSSTIVQASPSSQPSVSLTGKGCTIVVQAEKL